MNLLAVETASSVCGVALFLEGKLHGIEEKEIGRQHAEMLPLYTDRLLESRQVTLKELHGIAVSIGPGSFTGLRIGLSFAKGLAFSSDLPLAPVPTLEAMVHAASGPDGMIRCLLHSHRDFVYVQDFFLRGDRPVPGSGPFSVRWKEVQKTVPDQAVVYQYGCENLLDEVRLPAETVTVQPSARGVGEVALVDFDGIKQVDFHGLEPRYVSHFSPGIR
ncbi:MAG: tRNA (adenosine(37)-N6)-threonylcarbamoyltransferase complex dimerization subunit type 1 TsaB [Fidelibacterota bacterium]